MPFNTTTGVYSAPSNSWNPAEAGTVIDPDDWNNTQDDYVSAINEINTAINVKTFGAVGDGVEDDTAAFLAARTQSISSGKTLYLPAGTYNLASLSQSIAPWDGMHVLGDGPGQSVILWDDVSGPTNLFDSGVSPPSPPVTNAKFSRFTVRGTQDVTPRGVGSTRNPFVIQWVDELTWDSVHSIYSRGMGFAARSCASVTVTNCKAQYGASDGISVWGSTSYRIENNTVLQCDDDGISAHTNISSVAPLALNGSITGNVLFGCQGIRALGAVNLTIAGNALAFCYGNAIDVSTALTSSGTSGANATQGVSIIGNSVFNQMNRSGIDGLSSSGDYIVVSGLTARAGSGTAVPGWNDSGAGTVLSPYSYALNESDDSSTPIMPSVGVTISGNVCQRTVAPTSNFSDYGYGELMLRSGPSDPAVTAAMFQGAGVRYLGGRIDAVRISSNVFQGMGRAFYVTAASSIIGGLSFNGNTCFDLSLNGIAISADPVFQTVNYIRDNVFDCDPYLLNANRGSTGGWAATENLTALLLQSSGGWFISGNVFRNVSRISDAALTSSTSVTFTADNICEGKPASVGFSTSNIGVGTVPSGATVLWRIVEFDPNSADFRKIINNCFVSNSAMPSSGTYVIGHFVRNTAPAISTGKVLMGWSRLTTGSGHVLDTDWAGLYATNS
jgi:parallel beta-helix repeat protein